MKGTFDFLEKIMNAAITHKFKKMEIFLEDDDFWQMVRDIYDDPAYHPPIQPMGREKVNAYGFFEYNHIRFINKSRVAIRPR
ncbi:MAG: hypothetical protein CMF31_04985 [Kordiimonas sp.]|nr:hypothetical protein [Kordiimonas sp.]|tara:strand:- start:918 stop:1163 length:246 start_codon:yes stop_codon:yes gene_type:complete